MVFFPRYFLGGYSVIRKTAASKNDAIEKHGEKARNQATSHRSL